MRRRTGVAAADRELESSTAAMASASNDHRERMPLCAERYARALERWLALGAADLDERLPEAAARVGLDVDPTRPLGSLSGGQAARASLVAVLLSQFDVLLLDEPTNNLDPASREEILGALGAYEGAVILVSHDEGAVEALDPERVLIMPDGTEDLWNPEYLDLIGLA